MARRRRGFGRRAQRRRTAWTVGPSGMETAGTNTAAGASRDVLLLTNADDQSAAFTLVRTVGSVAVSLQAAPATHVPVFWGLYMAKSGGGGSYRLEARVDADVSEESWLYWRAAMLFGTDLTLNLTDTMVDIKVMRKFVAGDELRFNVRSQSAFESCQALRFLLMYA